MSAPYVVCLEPGTSKELCRVIARNQQVLVYPHVDSCMTVTVILDNKTVVGGHVSQQDEDGTEGERDPTASIENFCGKMRKMTTGEMVKVIFVGSNAGHMSAMHFRLSAALKALGHSGNKNLSSFAFLNTINIGRPTDVYFDLGSQKMGIQITINDPTRQFDVPPHIVSNPLFLKDYYQLTGKMDVEEKAESPEVRMFERFF